MGFSARLPKPPVRLLELARGSAVRRLLAGSGYGAPRSHVGEGRAALAAVGLIRPPAPETSPLAKALADCRAAIIGVAAVSGILNILALVSSLYMLEVYDRVLPSGSVPTLVALTALVMALYAFQALFYVLRGRILLRVGSALDESLGRTIFRHVVSAPLNGTRKGNELQPVRDLEQVRSFLSGSGPGALFDLPWIPIYLLVCFAFHFWIGATALGGALLLVALTATTERLTRSRGLASQDFANARTAVADAGSRNAETVRAMGMAHELGALWDHANNDYRRSQIKSAEVANGLGSVSKVMRMALQSAVMGVGAYLVVVGEATGGIIIASSILTARALAPVDQAIAHWRAFVAAREGWVGLTATLARDPDGPPRALVPPRPRERLSVEKASVGPPGLGRPTAIDISFELVAGQGLGVIGRSASGKSSLARMIVGVWATGRGSVRLDGFAMDDWSAEDLGRYVGYVPQEVELFPGTVAANIARFRRDATAQAIIEAAKTAGVHELIQRLPDGYRTQIGDRGVALSAGQRQRIALARALYGDPFLVVLDEPNSNLDGEGEQALTEAMLSVRRRGGIVIVIAHRPSALAAVDQVLIMNEGRVQALGPREKFSIVPARSVPADGQDAPATAVG